MLDLEIYENWILGSNYRRFLRELDSRCLSLGEAHGNRTRVDPCWATLPNGVETRPHGRGLPTSPSPAALHVPPARSPRLPRRLRCVEQVAERDRHGDHGHQIEEQEELLEIRHLVLGVTDVDWY